MIMSDHSSVRGITLTAYFDLHALQPFEDSSELDCLVGDLITKPQQLLHQKYSSEEKLKISEKSEDEENDENGLNTYETGYRNTQYADSPKPSVHYTSAKNSRVSGRRQEMEHNENETQKQKQQNKLSSVELRTSSIKVYKSDKMRIRQVSNSPYERKLSKQKDIFKTIYGGIFNSGGSTSTQHHPLVLEPKYPVDILHKFYRNTSSLMVEENKGGNSRHGRGVKEADRGGSMQKDKDIKKRRFEGVHSTMNAYAKKIREHQKAKHQL